MKKLQLFLSVLVITCFANATGAAAEQPTAKERPVIKLTATEWPPYSSDELPDQGFVTRLVKNTYARAGYDVEVDFSVWQRSLATAIGESPYAGTLIVYHSPGRRNTCHITRSFGFSELGFVQRRDQPVQWRTLEDLKPYHIGTVMGYLNTVEFDQMAEDQTLNVSAVHNDTLNLRRLAFGRIDLAVIDRLTMRFLLQNDSTLADYEDVLEFNPHLLARQAMYVCLRKDEEGQKLRDAFNSAFDPDEAAAIFRGQASATFDMKSPTSTPE